MDARRTSGQFLGKWLSVLAAFCAWSSQAQWTNINLAWDASPGATGYRIYRAVGAASFSPILDASNTVATVGAAISEMTRFYVTGTSNVLESGPSNVVTNNPPPPLLLVITAPTLLSGTNSYWPGMTITATATVMNRMGTPFDVYAGVLTARQPGASNADGPFDDFTPGVTAQVLAASQGLTLTASWGVRADAPLGTWRVYLTVKGTNGWVDGPATTFEMIAPPGPTIPPDPPTNLRVAQTQGNRFDITWASSPKYPTDVQRAPVGGTFTTLASVPPGTMRYGTTIKPHETWRFRARSCDGTLCSMPSNEVTVSR